MGAELKHKRTVQEEYRWSDSVHAEHKKLMRAHGRGWSIWGFMPLGGNVALILSGSAAQHSYQDWGRPKPMHE